LTFVGGQTPLFRRVPKRGFTNGSFAKKFNVVNVGDIDALFSAGEAVTPETLKEKGLAKKAADGVRILGEGELTKKLDFKAHHFSKSALAKIEAKGGKAEVIPPPKKPVRNKMKPPKVKEGK
jgi:large subunit ribosomal protein L15